MSLAMNQLVVVLDDEPDILKLVALHLTNAGFRVKEFTEAESFFHFLENQRPACVLLDLMLPDIDGLELGADDYITKPFSPRELVARVKAVLRRKQQSGVSKKIEFENLSLDLEKYEVVTSGKKVELTTVEFKILKFLASKPGWVFSREEILDHLWGSEKAVVDRTIDVHIAHLREKLGKAKTLVKNIRGVGYKLSE